MQPNVYLVGRQVINIPGMGKFLKDHNIENWMTDAPSASEKLIEVAGRLCYMSFMNPRPGGNKAYIQHILESAHGSVLEHGVYNFIITNISRSCTHELVRHRAGWAYSQLSQRYVDESNVDFIEPDEITKDDDLHMIWVASIGQAHESYKRLSNKLAEEFLTNPKFHCKTCNGEGYIDLINYCEQCKGTGINPKKKTDLHKAARQAARSVLPNATETKIFVTANCRALRHFIEMRASRYAEPEIRKVALRILEIMKIEAPNIFNDYEVIEVENGIFEAQTKFRKV